MISLPLYHVTYVETLSPTLSPKLDRDEVSFGLRYHILRIKTVPSGGGRDRGGEAKAHAPADNVLALAPALPGDLPKLTLLQCTPLYGANGDTSL